MQDAVTTFLFTDIEGSTRLWEEDPQRMRPALARHDAIVRDAVERHNGRVVKMTGDGLHAAFDDPFDAVLATLELQEALSDSRATEGLELRVRCGLHAGHSEGRDGDYYGTVVNRAARIMAVAHGGQMLVSQAVVERIASRLPPPLALRDLGHVRLRDLGGAERLYQLVSPSLRGEFPALRSLEGTPNNLPQAVSSFIGRTREISEVGKLLGRHRLVTLVGMGGLGKTRLSLHVAAESLDDYPDGVWLVELGPLEEGQRVALAIAAALGVREEGGRPIEEALTRHVRDRTMLVILDNCEHLLEASATLARLLLSAGAKVRVLATSREPLRIAGESTYLISGLPIPGPLEAMVPAALANYESVQLFVDRAGAALADFELDEDNATAVAAICHRLDGIPLAIELAAARARSIPIPQIAARLKDRFRLLTGGDPTAMPRQRTLRALIDWSHDLLADRERAIFRQVAMFTSGWTLAAAEAICTGDGHNEDTVLDLLARLVEKSLVAMDASRARYYMLDTVRQYGLERLSSSGEMPTLAQRHFAYYLQLAHDARNGLLGPDQARCLALLDADLPNLLAAHAAVDADGGDPQAGLQLASLLKHYWITRGLLELGERVTREALARPGAQAPNDARCRALFDAGQIQYFMGRYGEARSLLTDSLAIARSLGSDKKVGAVLQPLGMAALGEGDLAAARDCLTEALSLARRLQDPRDIATAANVLGQLLRVESDPRQAAILFEETIAISRRVGDQEMVAIGLLNQAMVSIEGGQTELARECLAAAWALANELGSRPLLKSALEATAGLAVAHGDHACAARFYGAAEAQAENTGLRRDPADSAFLAPRVSACRKALGDAVFDEREREGRGLAHPLAMSEARDWITGFKTTDPCIQQCPCH